MKTESRVPAGYRKGSEDWKAEYNMLLDDGVTCASCAHCSRCVTLFGQKAEGTSCQFYPSRFHATKEAT